MPFKHLTVSLCGQLFIGFHETEVTESNSIITFINNTDNRKVRECKKASPNANDRTSKQNNANLFLHQSGKGYEKLNFID